MIVMVRLVIPARLPHRPDLRRRAARLSAGRDAPRRPRPGVSAGGRLWPDVPQSRAQANVRSALWRLRPHGPGILTATSADLCLAPHVRTDISTARRVAQRLLDRSRSLPYAWLGQAMRADLYHDLLPGWDDEWAQPERDRFAEQRKHALEALSERLVSVGWYGTAIDAALAAVQADPLRESSNAALVSAYLAEGNYHEARRRASAFCSLARTELHTRPSDSFNALLEVLRT
jgi:DNA-binding SARP family transcriptional activator